MVASDRCGLKNNMVSEKMNGPLAGEQWINCSAQGEEESNTNRKAYKSSRLFLDHVDMQRGFGKTLVHGTLGHLHKP